MKPKKQYEKLRKKYKNLPNWKWFNDNFTIKESDDPLLKNIRKAIIDKIDPLNRGLIEPILSNSDNYCCWFERKMITKEDREKMFKVYKDFQVLMWESNRIHLIGKEKDYVNWIIKVKTVWEKNKKPLVDIFNKFSEGWKDYKSPKVETAYHG